VSEIAPVAEPVVEPAAPPVAAPEPVAPPAPLDDDAALDAALEKDAITINHAGDRMVPLSAVTTLRGKLKEVTPKAQRADRLAQENQQLQQRLAEVTPLAEAFRAVASAQAQPAAPVSGQPVAPSADDAEALEFAKHADLYDAQGQPDVAKAKALLAISDRRAEAKAQAAAAPFVQSSLQDRAGQMLERAKATKVGGDTPDPEIVTEMFRRIASQPGGLETLCDANKAATVVQLAMAQTLVKRAQTGGAKPPTPAPAPAAPLAPPLHTERAGGQDAALPSLNAGDRKVAKDLGLTETEYSKRLAAMPWKRTS
jgi:hypothetical protein